MHVTLTGNDSSHVLWIWPKNSLNHSSSNSSRLGVAVTHIIAQCRCIKISRRSLLEWCTSSSIKLYFQSNCLAFNLNVFWCITRCHFGIDFIVHWTSVQGVDIELIKFLHISNVGIIKIHGFVERKARPSIILVLPVHVQLQTRYHLCQVRERTASSCSGYNHSETISSYSMLLGQQDGGNIQYLFFLSQYVSLITLL